MRCAIDNPLLSNFHCRATHSCNVLFPLSPLKPRPVCSQPVSAKATGKETAPPAGLSARSFQEESGVQ
jgi:hypothetical protein